mgnify:CR=1 FL=1
MLSVKKLSKLNYQNKIIIAVVVLLIVLFIYFLKKKDVDKIDFKTKPTDGSQKNSVSTITDTQARTIARRLFDAMDRLGTDEPAIIRNTENLNGASLQKVYIAFKKPKYWAGEESGLFGPPTDLFGWFEGELGGKDLTDVKSIWRKSNLGWL